MEIKENIELSKTLESISPFLKDVYLSALLSFNQKNNKLRFNNCSTNFRELFRLFFEEVAPDSEIKKAHWFVPDSSSKNGITRAHRVKYSVYNFISPSNFQKDFSQDVNDLSTKLLSKIDQFSKYTHFNSKIVNINEGLAKAIIDEATELFINLLQTMANSKEVFLEYVEEKIQDELTHTLFLNTFDKIDILSTHTSIEEVNDIEFKIDRITPDNVVIVGNGSIHCELQYGSDSDQRNDLGYKTNDSYPFTFTGYINTSVISEIRINPNEITIDTDEFYN